MAGSEPGVKLGATYLQMNLTMERETGFEPATLALARRCSTTELFPLEWNREEGGGILLRRREPVKQARPLETGVGTVTSSTLCYETVTGRFPL